VTQIYVPTKGAVRGPRGRRGEGGGAAVSVDWLNLNVRQRDWDTDCGSDKSLMRLVLVSLRRGLKAEQINSK